MSECAAQLLRTVCMEVDTVTPKTEKEHLNNDDTVIPMLELRGEIDEIWAEISTAVHRVLRRGQFVSGPEVETFEAEVAAYLGVDHAVGVNSGTDALLIALRSAGIGPGDEVITTPFTFFATVEAIVLAGATPVFVDIGWDGFNIDVGSIEQAVTEHTRAVLPVHLFGDPVEMGSLGNSVERMAFAWSRIAPRHSARPTAVTPKVVSLQARGSDPAGTWLLSASTRPRTWAIRGWGVDRDEQRGDRGAGEEPP